MILFPPAAARDEPWRLRHLLGVFGHTRRAVELVWTTSRPLTVGLAALTVIAGLLPPVVARIAQLLIDAVLRAAESGAAADRQLVLQWVVVEAGVLVLLALAQRGLSVCQSLLRALLGHRVNVLVLEKALTLELSHFEDAEVYDKMTRARREASIRPLSLVMRTFGLLQNCITLTGLTVVLFDVAPWAALVILLAGIPAFVAETKFSGDAFRLFRWRSPETRRQAYLETVMAREDYAKEVQLYQLGPLLLDRYRAIFRKLYGKDRDLTIRRNAWGWVLGLVNIATISGATAWVALEAVAGNVTIGEMTMVLVVFKQGQSAVTASLSAIGGMYEDNLYVSTLEEFLALRVPERREAEAETGRDLSDGLRFEGVSFTYPGASEPTIRGVDLHVRPGEKLALVGENGAGKTTLIKLLTRLYEPQEGRILLHGRDLREWDEKALRRRIGVIFQDYVRYQFTVGENIGAGDAERFEDEERWIDSAEKGLAAPFIEELPKRYRSQLGRWFADGRELSTGQWQKVALSRAFMRSRADVLVLDEPTASMDAEAESQVFEHVRRLTGRQIAILISHRFSTVRMADRIVVLEHGRVLEQGSHDELVKRAGKYARLFELQAAGYR